MDLKDFWLASTSFSNGQWNKIFKNTADNQEVFVNLISVVYIGKITLFLSTEEN